MVVIADLAYAFVAIVVGTVVAEGVVKIETIGCADFAADVRFAVGDFG